MAPVVLGLGLFIAREIAQGHGGSIEVESSDQATTFTLSIPRQANAGQLHAFTASSIEVPSPRAAVSPGRPAYSRASLGRQTGGAR